ncbi:MAG: hypothetical protein QOJ62_1184 [Actinomycetota bacterium]|nr:hypothetical protein [Actinomycetota bacterium]
MLDDDHPVPAISTAPNPPSPAPDPRMPNGFAGAVSLAATVFVAIASTVLWPHGSSDEALVAMMVVVGVVAYWCRPLASAATAALGWLALNGFVVDHAGQLHWHGSADVVRLACLFGVALAASGAHALGLRLVSSGAYPSRTGHAGHV